MKVKSSTMTTGHGTLRRTMALAATFAAVAGVSAPRPALAATYLFPPSGSTAYIWSGEFDSGHGACDAACTIVSGSHTPITLPSTTVGSGLYSVTASGSVGPNSFAGMLSGSNVSPNLYIGVQNTFTVHGTATGPVALTAILHATGTVSSDSRGFLLGGEINLQIGTLNIDPLTTSFPKVDPFFDPSGSTQATQQIPFDFDPGPDLVPIDVTATYTFQASAGDVFNMAFGAELTEGAAGLMDLSHTATISFTTPDGVYLTNDLGGVFGAVPSVPLPAALPLFATGLAGLGMLGWRRRRKG